MTTVATIDAWTDLEVRAGLTELELSLLPEHPAGDPERELAELPGGLPGSDTTVSRYEQPHWN